MGAAVSYAQIPGWTCCEIERLYREWAWASSSRAASAAAVGGDVIAVEVGVAYGRSLAYLAEQIDLLGFRARLVGVDVWGEHMGGDNLPPDVFARMSAHGSPRAACVAELRAALSPRAFARVELDGRGSLVAAASFADASVDLVFIDARHEYEPCLADIRAWLPKVRPGGIIAGHDYSWAVFPGVIQAVEEVFGDGKRTICGVVWRVWR
jgi:predicted O-methyltransferase YrrM